MHFSLFVGLSPLALLFLLSLSFFIYFFPSLVSLWILGPEHSWVLTLAKGDPLRRRSMLANRTICLHCNIPLETPIEHLDWMKVFLTCMVALSQILCDSGHSLQNWSSNHKAIQCMSVWLTYAVSPSLASISWCLMFLSSSPFWLGINSLRKPAWIDKQDSSLSYLREANVKHPHLHLTAPQRGMIMCACLCIHTLLCVCIHV